MIAVIVEVPAHVARVRILACVARGGDRVRSGGGSGRRRRRRRHAGRGGTVL